MASDYITTPFGLSAAKVLAWCGSYGCSIMETDDQEWKIANRNGIMLLRRVVGN